MEAYTWIERKVIVYVFKLNIKLTHYVHENYNTQFTRGILQVADTTYALLNQDA